ncbi:MAG: SMP-30/gluconolactonase/LRE family protein [Chloroflexota bacterium]|nr:SMP-30/gluconolactonase/LRE family protein [Chloroflexota bacterium]
MGAGPLTVVAGGYQDLEAARWLPWDGVLVFADRSANTLYQLRPPAAVSVCRAGVPQPFGLALDGSGRLHVAAIGPARVVRLTAGGSQTLADRTTVDPSFTPNDLTVRSDGTIFVTSPDAEVVRIAPDGGASAVWKTDGGVHSPNGIVLAPDERTLYVGFWKEHVVRAFDLDPSGSLGSGRILAATAAQADGMTVDRAGDLYVSTQQGVQVFAPDGRLWGAISVPQPVFNCAFGGPDGTTLYILTASVLYGVELAVPGVVGR